MSTPITHQSRLGPADLADREDDEQPGHLVWLAVAVPSAIMLVLGFWGLNRGSMWQDESASFSVAQRSVVQILAMVRHVDIVHAAYYLGLHFWLLPGGGEVWLRVPSVLAAGASAGLVGAIGQRLAGVRTGLIAGVLFAGTPIVSYYAQEGRSYSIVCALVLLASYFLIRASDGTSPALRWPVSYLAAAALAIVVHEFAILALAAHALTLLMTGVWRRVWRWWVPSVLGLGLLTAPIALLSIRQSRQVSWLERPSWSTVGQLGQDFLGTSAWALLPVALLTCLGAAGLRVRENRIGLAALALPLAVVPPGILLLVSQVQPLYHVRYVLFAVAGVALLAASGLSRLLQSIAATRARPRLTWLVSILIVAGIFAVQLPAQQHNRTVAGHGNDLAGIAAIISREAEPGDAVLFLPSRFRAAALAYPTDFTAVHDIALDKTPVEAANLRGVDHSRRQVRQTLLSTRRVWVIGRTKLSVRPEEIGAVSARQVLHDQFTADRSYRVPGMQVTLFVNNDAER